MADLEVPTFSMATLENGKIVFNDIQISEVLDKDDTYSTDDGKRIIKYEGWKKIANYCGIVVSKQVPPALLTQPSKENKQQHVFRVILEYLAKPEIYAIGVGEASQLNTGKLVNKDGLTVHEETGHIDSEFKASMAYMRAYVRAMKDLVKMQGVFGDVEAPDFGSGTLDYKNL